MVTVVLLASLVAGQDARALRRDEVITWNELALDAIRAEKTPPPIAARNLAILHSAIYDTVNTIYKQTTHRPYRVVLWATESMDTDAAVAACGARVLSELFPEQTRRFDRALERTLSGIPASRPRSLGIGLGRHVADRMLEWRRDDDYLRPVAFRAGVDPGVWRPTPPDYREALLPDYGRQPRFGLSERKVPRLNPPPELDSREFRLDLEEVRALGGMDSVRRSAEGTLIAQFWNDGPGTCTPPGHWNLIAQEVSARNGLRIHDNARLFALLNISLADAAIVCWDYKYRYRLWRPITMIRQTEPTWTSLLDTPAFPSYTSGHSTFSGAAATILAQVFGSDEVEFTVGSDGIPGTERTYKGFWKAAEEAGRSRIFGGIHFECDNREGLALGKAIADEILRTRLLPRDGDATKPTPPPLEDGVTPRPLPKGPVSSTASTRRERP
ncbi:MAG: phosphatase PAP2 family protein [Gemmataceae bacterium]